MRKHRFGTPFTVLLILSSVALSPLLGGTGVWTTHGPDDGRRRVTGLVFDPNDHSILYAATQLGVLKSIDGGGSWRTTSETAPAAMLSISRSGVICAVTDGIRTSRDGGETWTLRGYPQSEIVARAVTDADGEVLYVATRSGFLKSDGEGKDLRPMNNGLSDLDVISLVVDPNDRNLLYAGTFNEGVFRSNDGGARWTASSKGLTNTLVFDLALDPSDSKTIYAGTGSRYVNGRNSGGGVFKSTNGGESWQSLGLSTSFVISVAVHPTDRRTIYAGTSGFGMFKTADGGGHWIPLPDGKIDHDDDFTDFFTIDRSQPSVIYAGTFGGLMKTSDGGTKWSHVTGLMNIDITAVAADPAGAGHVLAGNWRSFFVTSNGGTAWKPVDQVGYRPVVTLAFDPSRPANVFLGSYTVQKSTDGGKTWRISSDGIPRGSDPLGEDDPEMHAFAIDRRDSSIVFLATSQGLFKSTDGGANWLSAGMGIGAANVSTVAIDAFDSSIVYAFVDHRSVLKSIDGGSTWAPSGSGLPAMQDGRVTVDERDRGVVYATGSEGFFKTADRGATWTRLDGFSSATPISTLVVDPSTARRIYAGTAGSGVFRSDDGGSTWAAFNTGLTNLDVHELAIHPSGEHLYAATAAGVFDIEMTSGNAPPPAVSSGEASVVAGCGDIRSRVAEFRALLGQVNHGLPIRGTGRREFGWDDMDPVNPDASQTGDEGFFISPTTPFRVSDNNFADVNPNYAGQFRTFSPPNALAPAGTNIIDLKFAVRGLVSSNATVNSFGAVFSDVDLAGAASIELFADEAMQESLGEFPAPVRCDAGGLSFVGISLTSGQRISAVRIRSGQAALGELVDDVSDGGGADLVVIDDLIYSEPVPGDEVVSTSLEAFNEEDFNEVALGGFAVLSRDRRRGGPVMFSIVIEGALLPARTSARVSIYSVKRGGDIAEVSATLIDGRASGEIVLDGTLWREILDSPGSFVFNVGVLQTVTVFGVLEAGSPVPVRVTIPVAGHIRTANGALIKTEVRLINGQGGLTADALLQFYPSNDPHSEPRQAAVSVARGQQLVLDDVVGNLFGAEGIGALQILSSRPLTVGTRIYDGSAGYATPGQFVPALPKAGARRSAALPGLSQVGARTNIGWFNPFEVASNVTFRAFDANGLRLSSATRRLDPMSQLQISAVALFPDLPAVESFYVTFDSDIPVFIYASVIDSTSGDTSFISAQDSAASWVVPSASRIPDIPEQTNLQILNVGDTKADVVVEYFSAVKSSSIEVKVEPGQQKELNDLWADVQAIGALRIHSSRPVAVTSRTFVPSDERGTWGRTVPAVRSSTAPVSQGTLPLVSPHSSDERGRFIPSIGWFNSSAKPASIFMTFYSATGEPVGYFNKTADAFEQTESSFPGYPLTADSYVTFGCAAGVVVYGSIYDTHTGASMLIQPSLEIAPVPNEQNAVTYLHGGVFSGSTNQWAPDAEVTILDGPQAGATWSARADPMNDVYIIRGLTSGLAVTVRASASGHETQVRRVYLTAPYATFDFRLKPIK